MGLMGGKLSGVLAMVGYQINRTRYGSYIPYSIKQLSSYPPEAYK